MKYDDDGNVIVFLSAFTDDALNHNVMLMMSSSALLLLLLLLLLRCTMKYDDGNIVVFVVKITIFLSDRITNRRADTDRET